MIKKLKVGYSELWKAIIRPPRDKYLISDLGPKQFVIDKKLIKRKDFTLQNH